MKESVKRASFQIEEHNVDLCIIGGGMAGMLAAIAAGRRGVKVALMHDRPVFGGNASSEIRMWICGAKGENLRETGILEEISLKNIYRNPYLNFSVWDSVLYEMVRLESNIEMILNCSCCDILMDGERISWVKGWQTTTQTWHTVRAKLFADCSGDSVIAPLSGAEYRWGREGSDEFNEDIEPSVPDSNTMGMSCLIQARETDSPKVYIPPKWSDIFKKKDFSFKMLFKDPKEWTNDNFWWIELGGDRDSIHDTEDIKNELLEVAFGVWDFIKNSGEVNAENWELDWVGFLPGKRESRRYIGDYILNQNDLQNERKFNDIVAYGGWPMDDHHPMGFMHKGKPTVFHPTHSPYGIPYRCLYSKNVSNLLFAGRNISATHAALSSTRVMGTCSMLGQVVGTAASIAIAYGLDPREVYHKRIHDLKQALMDDDCCLPWNIREIPEQTKNAIIKTSLGDPTPLRNGLDRPIKGEYNGWNAPLGSWIEFDFQKELLIKQVRIVFDSDLNRATWDGIDVDFKRFPIRCNVFLDQRPVMIPKTLVKTFRIEVPNHTGGWDTIYREEKNIQRLVKIKLNVFTSNIKLVVEETWGGDDIRIFSFDCS